MGKGRRGDGLSEFKTLSPRVEFPQLPRRIHFISKPGYRRKVSTKFSSILKNCVPARVTSAVCHLVRIVMIMAKVSITIEIIIS